MALIHVERDRPIFTCPVGPSLLGKDNWGKINRFNHVVERPLGRGRPVEDMDIYHACVHVFCDGGRWEETAFYERACGRIARGYTPWGCATPQELRARLEGDITLLYRSIAQYGYLPQRRLARGDAPDDDIMTTFAAGRYHTRLKEAHDIKFAINEDGEVLFLDGRHRLAIARLLGVERVAGRVVFRHARMAERHALFRDLSARSDPARSWHTADHPDLARFALDRENLQRLHHTLAARGIPVPALHEVSAAGKARRHAARLMRHVRSRFGGAQDVA